MTIPSNDDVHADDTRSAARLRETFEAHEGLAPDTVSVLAGARDLARRYRRRHRATQAAGGLALGTGLVAGALSLPGLLPTGHGQAVVVHGPGGSPTTPTPSATAQPEQAVLEAEWDAYFTAGYGYQDALTLAELWQMPASDPAAVKAEAGRRLLAGEQLPITHSADPTADPTPDSQASANLAAFFAAGYDYADAEKLAALWNQADPGQAKLDAGRMLRNGQQLPIAP